MSDGMLEMECCRGLTVIAVIKAKEFSDNWYVDNLYSFKNKQTNKKTPEQNKTNKQTPHRDFLVFYWVYSRASYSIKLCVGLIKKGDEKRFCIRKTAG